MHTTIQNNDPNSHSIFPGGRAGVLVSRPIDLVVAFLNGHSVSNPGPTVVAMADDGLSVVVRTELHHADTGWQSVEETIPATMRAARDWLGY